MKSLRTALRLLAAFSANQRDWGVGELADFAKVPKSQASKILAAYRDHGLLKQDAVTRRYQVDCRAFVIGSRFLIHDALSREALPIMRAIGNATGHSARLCIRDGNDLIYLLTLEGPHFIDTGWRAGSLLPWHATSAGRVLLAYMDEENRRVILDRTGMASITPRTITDRGELTRILDLVRRRGFSVVRGESTAGLGAISVPVLGANQEVRGTLALAFPEHLVSRDGEAPLVESLRAAAATLSIRNGSAVYSLPGAEMSRKRTGVRRKLQSE